MRLISMNILEALPLSLSCSALGPGEGPRPMAGASWVGASHWGRPGRGLTSYLGHLGNGRARGVNGPRGRFELRAGVGRLRARGRPRARHWWTSSSYWAARARALRAELRPHRGGRLSRLGERLRRRLSGSALPYSRHLLSWASPTEAVTASSSAKGAAARKLRGLRQTVFASFGAAGKPPVIPFVFPYGLSGNSTYPSEEKK